MHSRRGGGCKRRLQEKTTTLTGRRRRPYTHSEFTDITETCLVLTTRTFLGAALRGLWTLPPQWVVPTTERRMSNFGASLDKGWSAQLK